MALITNAQARPTGITTSAADSSSTHRTPPGDHNRQRVHQHTNDTATRDQLRQLIESEIRPLLPGAERHRRFPREAVAALGAAGIFRQRWTDRSHGNVRFGTAFADALGHAGVGGIGVGVSLHLESALGLLVRFGRSDHAREVCEQALQGRAVLCLASSEQHVGSDISSVATRLERVPAGWRVHGSKWFVSPGSAADYIITVCAADNGTALVLVPRTGVSVLKKLETTGLRSLETVRLYIDTIVPDDAVFVRPGLGLQAATWGLMHERLAVAAQLLGGVKLALELAGTHMHMRMQFGVPLIEHQALRLRIAGLTAEAMLAQHAVDGIAAGWTGGIDSFREAAAAKVTIARFAERAIGECAHVFGGRGYLDDETPLARLWRDTRVGRLGAGSDEMMWEIVADGLHADAPLYDSWVTE